MENAGYVPLPSLADLAAQHLTLEIPWYREYRALGAGFDSKFMNLSQGPWKESIAFDKIRSHKPTYNVDATGGAFTYKDSSSSSHFDSTEHFSANMGVSVGCKLASVGVSGSYDKTVLEQRNGLKSSRNATCSVGRVLFDLDPVLARPAAKMLATPNGSAVFREAYGDYFVAGYELGADAGACLSASSAASSSSENMEVKIQVKVLCFKHEADVKSEHHEAHSASAAMHFVVYDSLSQAMSSFDISKGDDLQNRAQEISDRMSSVASLLPRVRATIEALGVGLQGTVDPDQCRQLCLSGVVKKLILQPYTICSDFVLSAMESARVEI